MTHVFCWVHDQYFSTFIMIVNRMFQMFMTMGLPKVLTTDQGSEFKNGLNEEIMKKLKIKHHLITPYHPQVYVTIL